MMCQANSTAGCGDGVAPEGALQSGDGIWTKEMKSAAMRDAQNVCDLSMIVRKFLYRIDRGLPLEDFAEKVEDFMHRKGLNGSPLRSADEEAVPADTVSAASSEGSLTPQNYEAKAREIADKVFDLLDDTIPDHKGVLSAISSAISSAVQAERERIRGMLVSKADALAIEAQIPGDPSRTAILMAKGQAYAEASSLLSAVSDADVEEGIRIAREIRPAIEAEIASAIRQEDANG